MFEAFAKIAGNVMEAEEKRKLARDIERDRKGAIDNYIDRPYYVAESAPQYQQTKSPVARAYLESFLTGANPNMVRSTGADSGYEKQVAQSQFDQRYGGWDAIQRAQNAELADNARFQPKIPQRSEEQARSDATKEFKASNPDFQKRLGKIIPNATDEDIMKYGEKIVLMQAAPGTYYAVNRSTKQPLGFVKWGDKSQLDAYLKEVG